MEERVAVYPVKKTRGKFVNGSSQLLLRERKAIIDGEAFYSMIALESLHKIGASMLHIHVVCCFLYAGQVP